MNINEVKAKFKAIGIDLSDEIIQEIQLCIDNINVALGTDVIGWGNILAWTILAVKPTENPYVDKSGAIDYICSLSGR